jgi:hypothetical protein
MWISFRPLLIILDLVYRSIETIDYRPVGLAS